MRYCRRQSKEYRSMLFRHLPLHQLLKPRLQLLGTRCYTHTHTQQKTKAFRARIKKPKISSLSLDIRKKQKQIFCERLLFRRNNFELSWIFKHVSNIMKSLRMKITEKLPFVLSYHILQSFNSKNVFVQNTKKRTRFRLLWSKKYFVTRQENLTRVNLTSMRTFCALNFRTFFRYTVFGANGRKYPHNYTKVPT